MKLPVCVAVVAVAACAATAKDVTILNGVTDWTAGESYQGGQAPAAGDNVIVPADTAVTLDAADTASWELVESLARLIPEANTSVLTVRVETAEAKLTTPFAIDTSSDFGDYRSNYTGLGEFVKVGEGNLEIGGAESRFLCSGRRLEYNTRLTVKEGILTLPQNVTTGNSPCYGPTTIEAGATVVGITVRSDLQTSVWPSFAFYSLSGEGTLTSNGPRPFNVNSIRARGVSVFAGKLSGTLSGSLSGALELTGTENDTTGTMSIYYNGSGSEKGAFDGGWWGGFVRAVKIGKTGEPSSIGSAGTIKIGNYGGGIVYLGEGEETDKTFSFTDGSNNLWGYGFIDGGATGGLVWQGPWSIQTKSSATKTSRLVMKGSNTTACVMSGVIADATGDDKVDYPLYLIKKGSGTWRMADNAQRTGGGGYAIEEGTLQFDSIAEKGTVCSLGTALNLTESYSGRDIENHRVNYAYLLGTPTTVGTMEYVGSAGGTCSTRPVAVNGKGRFKVSGTGPFAFNGISVQGDDAELVLDTDRTEGVSFGGITDGAAGTLKVTKEGTGSLMLTGNSDFSGGLDVKAGTVVVSGTGRPVPAYRWYRWIIPEKGLFCDQYKDRGWSAEHPAVPGLTMEEFAMFDSDGKRIDKGLVYSDLESQFYRMQAGSVAWETPATIATCSAGREKITSYFDGGAGSSSGVWGGICVLASVWPFCSKDTPNYWFKFVVRLPENAKVAASFDLACFWGASRTDTRPPQEATAVKIEGSVDGVNWEPVVDKDLDIPEMSDVASNQGGCWYSDPERQYVSSGNTPCTLKDHVGFPMRGTSTNVVAAVESIAAPVSVASGATLEADGAVTLSSLKLAVGGNGTIKGFTLADEGTLDVTGFTGGSQVELPVTLTDVTGVANLENWTLTVDGVTKASRYIQVGNDGKVYLCAKGLTVIVR